MFGAIKNSWIRATELADAARKTGPSGKRLFGIPGMENSVELGAGEFLRGFFNRDLDPSDAANPKFQQNLAKEIVKDVKPENQGIFERDFKVAAEQEAEAKVQAEEQARADWLHKTRNSPAARSGAFTDDQRWNTQKQHQDWKSHRKAGTLDDFAKKYPQSQTAKERAMNNRILSPMDMDY